MKTLQIRVVVWLGALSILGIVSIQGYFLLETYSIREKQFNQTIFVALKNVADRLSRFNQTVPPSGNPVRQLSSNYFVVDVNSVIDANILEYYLKTEFDKLSIHTDYEYAIYDCHTDRMVYGDYITAGDAGRPATPASNLPKYNEYLYYFGVHFPLLKNTIASDMKVWFFLTAILSLSILFFAYAIFVILRQKKLSELQKDFINNMTHEFKTPISSINISAEVILDPQILQNPERLTTYGRLIRQENHRLNLLVEKVLQIARIERGHLTLKREILDLNLLVGTIAGKYRSNLKPSCTLHLKTDPPEMMVAADLLHTTNILINILDNAAKYSGDGAIIEIATLRTPRFYRISIRDNGPGIPAKYQRRIFDKFYRIPTGNQHDVKGFGLGLYYVRQICRAHKWNLILNSEAGKGSEFTIIIPLNNHHRKWKKRLESST